MKKTVLWLTAASTLAACSTPQMKVVKGDLEKTQDITVEQTKNATVKMDSAPLFSKQNTFWVDKTPLPTKTLTVPLPPLFKKKYPLNYQTLVSLQDVLSQMNQDLGILFTLSQDVFENSPRNIGSPQGGGSQAQSGAAALISAAQGSGGGGAKRPQDILMSDLILPDASVAEVLDVMAIKTNLSWKYDGEKVKFFRYDTRVFTIDALAGIIRNTSKISNASSLSTANQGNGGAGGAGASGAGTSQDMQYTVSSDVWADVSNRIESLLSPKGKLMPLTSLGQVAVIDTVDNLKRIEKDIEELNKELSKQIAFNVNVYSVELNSNDQYGLDWNLFFQTLNSKYRIGLSSPAAAIPGTNLTLSLLNSQSGLGSNFNGSEAIFAALSTMGKTTLVTSAQAVTLNNTTVPIAVTKETAYLQKSTTVLSTGGATTALEPGLVTTGFTMNLLPRANKTEKMLLHFSMDLSDLVEIVPFASPDGRALVQLPQTDRRNLSQRVRIRSGETLILSGFQQTRNNETLRGIGKAENTALGGAKGSNGKSTTLVVMVTPFIMN